MASKIDPTKLEELKVVDLKKLCKERNLPTNGVKAVLIEQLKKAVATEEADNEKDNADLEDEVLNMISKDEAAGGDEESAEVEDDSALLEGTEETEEKAETETPAPAAPTTISTSTAEPTFDERKAARRAKFGTTETEAEKQKAAVRAQKFGLPLKSKDEVKRTNKSEMADQRQKRAERFGIPTPQGEKQKVNKRKERFGGEASAAGGAPLSAEEEERKKKRAERFAATN
ncbi:hypothetical protein PROFUN_09750 [Planoprotostelium fungivorum]|uniref:SAP domain-containing protein n=1 Tax=Planoprotostelium fungivorum TaxID=1890364 RepID=A0A2P6NFA8_9EUKA|nr:hypothetical protein PROFUN_09750 [Planoprotostelium fungivorum]